MTSPRLRRIAIKDLPDSVMTLRGAILFRHYLITPHAIDRFVERSGRPACDIIEVLHTAVLAEPNRARAGVRRFILLAAERGGYVLMSGACYFIVTPTHDRPRHVVRTVLTDQNIN